MNLILCSDIHSCSQLWQHEMIRNTFVFDAFGVPFSWTKIKSWKQPHAVAHWFSKRRGTVYPSRDHASTVQSWKPLYNACYAVFEVIWRPEDLMNFGGVSASTLQNEADLCALHPSASTDPTLPIAIIPSHLYISTIPTLANCGIVSSKKMSELD